ncbi:hypothetical protein ERJ75_001597400 [Trypanosoma vivax]|uniref:Tim10-like domain-containing protein n=1 Tax=Trypanosoma vivax (strain Y486) TaxID=1055687 RepID=G0TSH4_TRYVY|nr:hypothetical protein TRVL_03742 [Trypanosoma vivax]KAH8605823.1 hypothetical protein ERJ75_001597400 [Trypanosoma vivax]CCC46901.1 conserved hypothetical protein [Trypanosoma vivax Y486]
MQPVQPNPQLAGMAQRDVVVLAERLQLVTNEGFEYCMRKCLTHYGEDSIPYHPGEKACVDRCINKVHNGFLLSKSVRSEFESKMKAGDMPYEWMKSLASMSENNGLKREGTVSH